MTALVNAGEPRFLQEGLKGVEKESLRVQPGGVLAQTPHPYELGSALTNEHLTTDFSESLIELVTPAFRSSWELVQYLCDLHQFTYRHLGDELLWATSMPCRLASDAEVPIAYYGESNVGRMKSVYRHGLRNRYGGLMQAISGVHFNYSFPAVFWEAYAAARQSHDSGQAFRSQGYFELLRNYRRHGWLVLYLFGTSPTVGKSFLKDAHTDLPMLDAETAYEPYGTSLRMSDIGYRNRNQAEVSVSVNSLDEYVRDLRHAISTPHPPYEQIGLCVDGKYQQLNSYILQIENEYYSYIRPTRVTRSGESPSAALLRGGVEYVEVRALDVSAFDPVGVNQNTLRFMEAFVAMCVLRDSPSISTAEQAQLDDNHLVVARRRPTTGDLHEHVNERTATGRPCASSRYRVRVGCVRQQARRIPADCGADDCITDHGCADYCRTDHCCSRHDGSFTGELQHVEYLATDVRPKVRVRQVCAVGHGCGPRGPVAGSRPGFRMGPE